MIEKDQEINFLKMNQNIIEDNLQKFKSEYKSVQEELGKFKK
jgi:hypothetical protein